MAKANVICRCEEIEIDEIRKWIAAGYTEFDEYAAAKKLR